MTSRGVRVLRASDASSVGSVADSSRAGTITDRFAAAAREVAVASRLGIGFVGERPSVAARPNANQAHAAATRATTTAISFASARAALPSRPCERAARPPAG